MIIMRDMKPEDMEAALNSPFQNSIKFYPKPENMPDNSFTCLWDDDIIGIGGILIDEDRYGKGAGEVWVIRIDRPLSTTQTLALFRALQNKIENIAREHNLKKIVATARMDFPQAIKLIEALGFKKQNVIEKALPDGKDGCDAIIYSKIME